MRRGIAQCRNCNAEPQRDAMDIHKRPWTPYVVKKNNDYICAPTFALARTRRATISAAISASLSALVFSKMRLRLRFSFANSLAICLRSALTSFLRASNTLVAVGSSVDARSNACCKMVCASPAYVKHIKQRPRRITKTHSRRSLRHRENNTTKKQ